MTYILSIYENMEKSIKELFYCCNERGGMYVQLILHVIKHGTIIDSFRTNREDY